jgi:Major Facilitator Superfamily
MHTKHMSASELSKAGIFTGIAAVRVVAAMIGVSFAGSTLITPLYIIYEQAFGFSKITLTLIYAAYVIGNLASLLLFGRLSDQMGRRFAALPGLAICAAGGASFLFAHGVVELYAGRILTGLGVGIAAASGTAWLAELTGRDKARATTIATGANFLGIALSPLLAGLLADFTASAMSLPFLAYIALVVLVALLTWRTQETVTRRVPASQLSLRPRIGVPAAIRVRFIAPALAGFGAMALIGFYAALAPSLLAENLHLKSHALAGALVCELGLLVAGAIVLTRNVASRTAMLWAIGLMIPSVAMVAAAQAFASIALMLAGTALCGAAAGLGYRGSLQVVNEIAPADRRSEVLAAYFICCFIGNAVPVIGVGVITVFAGALTATASFAVLIALFAIAAFAFAWHYR